MNAFVKSESFIFISITCTLKGTIISDQFFISTQDTYIILLKWEKEYRNMFKEEGEEVERWSQ